MANYSTVDGYKFDAQNNYGWGLTLNMTGKAPEVSKRIFDTYEHMLYYVNDYNDSCVPGLVLKVMGDTDTLKNGVYFVAKIGTNKPEVNENGEVVLDDKGQPVLSNTFANDGEVIKLASEGKVSGDVSVLQEALEAEIAARKAVDGQTGQTYAANSNTTYISGASSLNDADAKLDVAISNEVSAREQAIEDILGDVSETDAKTIAGLNDKIDEVSANYLTNINVNGIAGTVASNIASVTIEGDNVVVSTEYGDAVVYPTISNTAVTFNSVSGNDTVSAAIKKLDQNISTLVDEVLKNEEVNAAAITEIKESVGLDENLKYVVNNSATYISGATTLSEADNLLDAAIKNEVSAREQADEDLQDAIDAVRDAVISVAAGDGISVTGEGTEKTITAVANEKDSLITVTENGIGIKADGYIDCGTF